MKKTLVTLLMSSCLALGEVAYFPGLNGEMNGIVCENGVITAKDGGNLSCVHQEVPHASPTLNAAKDYAATMAVITLNLTAMSQASVTGNFENIITFGAQNDLGLGLNSSGQVQGLWEATAGSGAALWSSSPKYAVSNLLDNSNVFVEDNVSYLTLGVVVGGDYQTNGYQGIGGLVAYDADGTKVFEMNRLSAAGNAVDGITSITINSAFVTQADIYTEVPYIAGGVGSWAVKYIPEPTTATLSLLALAGLAARRRRK
ncbi:MAG: PEP-CTERM sorting domain-containing protein [Akkermansia sp.]|nr:PEP-CTERM sorting domain-containing protein [Akkermansia sp.]